MMNFLPNLIFAVILVLGIGYFANNVKKLIRNIKLGREIDASVTKRSAGRTWPRLPLVRVKWLLDQ